jgi:hypothetical protein
MPAVLMRVDEAGEWPVLVRESDRLFTSKGVRWRFVAEVEDEEQGWALLELLQGRRATRLPHGA